MGLLKEAMNEEKTLNNRLELENDRLTTEIEEQRQLKLKLENEISQKNSEIRKCQLEIEKREKLGKEMTSAVKLEFESKIEERKREFEQLKVTAESEKKQIEEKHILELGAVSAKVKSLIEGKEQTIQALKDQLSVAQTRLRQVEELFHQQKKSILGVKK
jgi:chromosome segregation ATPase